MVSTKILGNTRAHFIENQISILEWFLKDHVTGVIDAEISALPSQK